MTARATVGRGLFGSVCYHTTLVLRLAIELLSWVITGTRTWFLTFFNLLLFVILLLPGWFGFLWYYLFDRRIVRNIEYGLGGRYRNLLDIYLPHTQTHAACPVVVFVSGGAYIIGYKMWSALVARGLSKMGCLVVVPDYRNFPQGDMEEMQEDVRAAVAWTLENIHSYGSSADKVVLAGQSAGAQICLSALCDAYEDSLRETVGTPLGEMLSMSLNDEHSTLFGSPHAYRSRTSSRSSTPASTPFWNPHAYENRTNSRSSTPASTPGCSATWRSVGSPLDSETETASTLSGTPAAAAGDGRGAPRSVIRSRSSSSWLPSLFSWVPGVSSILTNPSSSPRKLRFAAKAAATYSTPLDLSRIALFIGVSGPYDLFALRESLHARGLDSSILSWICRGNLSRYSPTRRIAQLTATLGPSSYSRFPRTALFHGCVDATVPLSICQDLAAALLKGGAVVFQRYYPGLSHTDPILEGPLKGDLSLMVDCIEQIHLACGLPLNLEAVKSMCDPKIDRMTFPFLVGLAKKVNPF